MKPEDYRKTRKTIGTQAEVAEMLGIARETVNARENGRQEISREAELALRSLNPAFIDSD